jgi:Ca2+:H+ antiporter
MSDQPASENVDLRRGEGGRPAEHFWWHPSREIRSTLFGSYANLLLVFVPIGIVAGTFGWPVEAVFFLNLLAVIPLAPIMAFSIDELSASIGYVSNGLIKVTLGSAVEMIVRYLKYCALIYLFLTSLLILRLAPLL